MMTVTRKVGTAGIAMKLAKLTTNLDETVEENAQYLQWDAQNRVMNPPKTGRVYTVGPPPLPHQASAPGESPANWTGALEASVTHDTNGPLSREVKASVEYATYLEFGTARMEARPFMTPAREEVRPRFIKGVKDAVKDAFGP